MKTYFVSLGCPKNTVDAEASLGLLQRAGCTIMDDPRDADLLIVNACSFIDAAWRETLEEVEHLARIKEHDPPKKLVLMGCLPLHRGDGWRESLRFVDHFLPAGGHSLLPSIVESFRGGHDRGRWSPVEGLDRFAGFEKRVRITPRHIAYVKIAEGCSRCCTFCAIPRIRGAMVSRTRDSIVREIETLRENGAREVSLLAQDVALYSDGRKRFADLIGAIVGTGVDWIRILYLHPGSLTIDLARRIFEHPSVCRYLEVPVQHASDRVLERMGRHYTRKHLERVLGGIRSEFPDVVVRSEVMVGFPGEEDSDFDELKSFVESAQFASLGVFVYSREAGTAASSLDGRAAQSAGPERASEIVDIQRSVTFGLLSDQKGRKHRVLVDRLIEKGADGHGDCSYAGRYYGQAYEIDGEVYLNARDLTVGEFVEARITNADVFDLEAELDHSYNP
jgi:ribosomal protein S12 methylthiotransferase